MSYGWGNSRGGGISEHSRGYRGYEPSSSSRGSFAERGRGGFRGRGGRPSGPFSPDPVSQIYTSIPKHAQCANLTS
jgi:hypothetical protein